MKRFSIFALPLAALALQACAATSDAATPASASDTAIVAATSEAAPTLEQTEDILMKHIEVLASDDYMGRKPGTEGGRKTIDYLAGELEKYGFEPGYNGSFEQKVAFERSAAPKVALLLGDTVIEGEGVVSLAGSTDFDGVELARIASTDDIDDTIAGKLMVIENPMLMREAAQAGLEAGARGAIVLAGDALLANFAGGAQRERVKLADMDNGDAEPVFIFLGDDASAAFKAANADMVSAAYTSDGTRFESANVIGRLPGSRPEAGAIVMMAHWDHIGECGEPDAEDRICNGAVDNASGIAAMLETARRLAAGPQLERDVYIMGTTAEEMGLLGATYFAENPPRPLDEIHAALNIDTVAIAPADAPLSVIGWKRTPLDASIEGVAASLGRTVEVGDESDKYVRRQDGWALMNKGVPSVLVSSSFGDAEATDTYMSSRYHAASDEIWEGFEIGGAASDVPVYVALMRHWATPALYSKPEGWTFDNEE